MLATQAAIALIADDKDLQFRSALASRDMIGQAKGMIMERFDVDGNRAFELLKRLSPDSNTRLVDVATELIARGQIPPISSRARSGCSICRAGSEVNFLRPRD